MLKELKKRLLSSIILFPMAIFFIIQGTLFFIFFLSVIFLITSYEWFKMSGKNNLLRLLGIIFLLISFYTAFEIRENYTFKNFLFIVIVCVFTDIGGYAFGKIFKGPKLTKISPNKTYVGVLGSFLLSIIAAFVFIYFLGKESTIFGTDTLSLLLIILFISLINQTGDLIISYFKRKAKIKDTGKILPGHGGLLDRIDGMIFVFPTYYLVLI